MRALLLATAAFILIACPGRAAAQNDVGSVSGVVRDAATGRGLVGASVVLIDAVGAQKSGAATSSDGTFVLQTVSLGEYTLIVRYLGYPEEATLVQITAGIEATVDLALTMEGIQLETVTITGTRAMEKVLDVPAAISVLSGDDVRSAPAPSIVDALRSMPGVQVADTGVDNRSLNLRGFNRAFNSATNVLTDYRVANLPALNRPSFGVMPSARLDLDRVEIVRGPVGAVYGPGYGVGVIHFISRSPFAHPGTSFLLTGGERSAYGGEFRHAGTSGPLGFKVVAEYFRADDWTYSPDDSLDVAAVARHVEATRDLSEKRKINGELSYQLGRGATITAVAGLNEGTGNSLADIGLIHIGNWRYTYGQLRASVGKFFGQVYLNATDAQDSFLYSVDRDRNDQGDALIDKSLSYNAQAQYRLAEGGSYRVIVGADAEWMRPRTGGTITGRNEDRDHVDKYGAYVQSSSTFGRLELSAAIRTDYFGPLDAFFLSPRIAAVYKPEDGHAVRLAISRNFSPPSYGSLFNDMVVGRRRGANLVLRGSGKGWSWMRDAGYGAYAESDLVAFSTDPASLGARMPVGMPIGDAYLSAFSGFGSAAEFADALAGHNIMLDVASAEQLLALLAPGHLVVNGFSDGTLFKENSRPGQIFPVGGLTDLPNRKPRTSQTVEVGYRGLVGSKLVINAEAWVLHRSNGLGLTAIETPWVFVPDLSGDLEEAISDGIGGSPELLAHLSSIGLNPAELSAVLVAIGSDQLPDASTPIGIVEPSGAEPLTGQMPEMFRTSHVVGDLTVAGIDAAAEFHATDNWRISGNASFLNDNDFDFRDLDVDDPTVSVKANVPRFKGNVSSRFRTPNGWSIDLTARYRAGFPYQSGLITGTIEESVLFDLGLGFDLGSIQPGFEIQLGITNVLDKRHRELVGAPKLGRFALLRLIYDP